MPLINKKLIQGKVVKNLNEIKKNSKVAIMSADRSGVGLYRLISKYRKDIKVTCFLEGHLQTTSKSLFNIKVNSIFQKNIDADIILFLPLHIFTKITKKIKNKLILKKIKKCFIGDLNFFNRFSRNGQEFSEKEIKKTLSIIKHRYSRNLFKEYIAIQEKKSFYDYTKLLIKNNVNVSNVYFEYNFFKTKKKILVVEGGSNIFEKTHKIFNIRKKNFTSIITFDPLFQFRKFYKDYSKKYYNKLLKKYDKNFRHKNLALFSDNKIRYFNFSKKHEECFITSKKIANHKSKAVQCITLDKFCKNNKITNVDYLKLDCENSEKNILLGGRDILNRSKTNICTAVYHSKNDIISIIKLLHTIAPENKIYLQCDWYNGIGLTAYSKNNIN